MSRAKNITRRSFIRTTTGYEPDFEIQGLASYWFEVEATAYISDDGDISRY